MKKTDTYKNLYKILTLVILLIFNSNNVKAQALGLNNPTPNGSSILDILSTTKGVLIPRMSTLNRTNILSAADGLLVFDTDINAFYYYDADASIWRALLATSTSSSSLISGWSTLGNAGTDPATNFFGTTDAKGIVFKTNASERVRINSTGEMGIGMTAVANNTLDITNVTTNGKGLNITANSLTTGNGLNITANSLTTGNGVLISSSSAAITSGSLLGLSSSGIIGNTSGSILNITSTAANTNGYLATIIGNSVVAGGLLNVSTSSASSTGTLFHVASTGASIGTVAMISNAGTGLTLRINDDGTDTDTTPVVVDSIGKVGIGTISPLAKFEVSSTSDGVLFPRMTSAQREALTVGATVNGLLVFDTDIRAFMYYDNSVSAWRGLSSNIISWGNTGNQAKDVVNYLPVGTSGAGTTVLSNTNDFNAATTVVTLMTGTTIATIANSSIQVEIDKGDNAGSDVTNKVSVNAGDVIVLKVDTSFQGVGSINDLRCSIEFY